jgi:hypothetical protein
MIRETYRGRKLTARAGKGSDWGRILLTVNGEALYAPVGRDERAALGTVKAQVDFIDRDPSVDGDRWAACWYAPGTYEMCPGGLHPQDIGGPCRHSSCARKPGVLTSPGTAPPPSSSRQLQREG